MLPTPMGQALAGRLARVAKCGIAPERIQARVNCVADKLSVLMALHPSRVALPVLERGFITQSELVRPYLANDDRGRQYLVGGAVCRHDLACCWAKTVHVAHATMQLADLPTD